MKAMAPSSTEIALYSRELDTSPRSLGFTDDGFSQIGTRPSEAAILEPHGKLFFGLLKPRANGWRLRRNRQNGRLAEV